MSPGYKEILWLGSQEMFLTPGDNPRADVEGYSLPDERMCFEVECETYSTHMCEVLGKKVI